MKLACFTVITSCLILSGLVAAGQNQPEQMFRVLQLPRKAGYSRDELNQKLISANNRDAVRTIIRTSIKDLRDITIVVRVSKPAGQFSWWTIDLDRKTETETDFALLRSKVTESDKIYHLQELKELLKDTVFVKDTLSLQLLIQDEDLAADRYFLYNDCNATGESQNINLQTTADGHLLITATLFAPCPDLFHKLILRNEESGGRNLVSFTLFFPDENLKEMLLTLAAELRQEKTGADDKAIADYMAAYIKQNYGRASYKQLTRWLQLNK
jgi:hypothetical protein